MPLPPGVSATLDGFLDACDAAVPGFVVGLCVAGSIALGDYRADRSDVDVVVVVREPPDAAVRLQLSDVHRETAPAVDGPYLTAAQLAQVPGEVGPVAHHVNGHFAFGLCHEVSPVTWAILAHDAITVRGAAPADLGVRDDEAAVRLFSAANLESYWASWSTSTAAVFARAGDTELVDGHLVEWGVLGGARVHCAATTGRVVSKRAGGEYALAHVGDEWHDIVELALAVRADAAPEVDVRDVRTACAFVEELCQPTAGLAG